MILIRWTRLLEMGAKAWETWGFLSSGVSKFRADGGWLGFIDLIDTRIFVVGVFGFAGSLHVE